MMNIDFMIFVDRFLGIPICWVLSQIHKIEKVFFRKKESSCKKILFIKPSEMGTSVIMYPMLKKAREMFPSAELYFLVFEENREILEVLDIIDKKNIIAIRTSSIFLFLRDVFLALSRLRKKGIDTVIDLEFFTRFTSILSYLSGAKKRVGFYGFNMRGLYRGDLLTHKLNYNYNVHCGVSFMSLLYSLKYDGDAMPLKESISINELVVPRIKIDDESKRNIFNKLKKENSNIDISKKIVVINPNTSQLLPFRKWPLEHYIHLSQKLIWEHEDVYIVVTGTRESLFDAQEIRRSVKNERCIDLAGKTSIKELIDLLNIATVLVSVDSGPAHFAALTGINIVCIFGPDTPIIFSPLSEKCTCLTSGYICNPCMTVFNDRKPVCKEKDKPCLAFISVDRVYSEVKKFLL